MPVRVSLVKWWQNLLLVGSLDGKLRVYDAARQRRPLLDLPVSAAMTLSCGYTQRAIGTPWTAGEAVCETWRCWRHFQSHDPRG